MYNDALYIKTISFRNCHNHRHRKYAQFVGLHYDWDRKNVSYGHIDTQHRYSTKKKNFKIKSNLNI